MRGIVNSGREGGGGVTAAAMVYRSLHIVTLRIVTAAAMVYRSLHIVMLHIVTAMAQMATGAVAGVGLGEVVYVKVR